MEEVLVMWIDQTSLNIFLSQSLIQSQALTLQFHEGWESEEAAEEKFEGSRGWFMGFKEISLLQNVRIKVKQQVLM